MVIQPSWIHSIFRSQRDRKHRKCFEWKRFFMKQTLIVKEECLMMRMLEEMTGFDFFWHHHVSNFRGATLDNGEENNYCLDSNIKSKHFSPVISCSRSFKSLLQAQDLRKASNCAFKKGHHTISPHGKRVDVINLNFWVWLKKERFIFTSRPNHGTNIWMLNLKVFFNYLNYRKCNSDQ